MKAIESYLNLSRTTTSQSGLRYEVVSHDRWDIYYFFNNNIHVLAFLLPRSEYSTELGHFPGDWCGGNRLNMNTPYNYGDAHYEDKRASWSHERHIFIMEIPMGLLPDA